MKARPQLAVLMGFALASCRAMGQPTPGIASIKSTATVLQTWEYTLTTDGYILPGGTFYVSPVLTADHGWLHLEARYNDENLRTASLWVGYNFHLGDTGGDGKWEFDITPILGGVFGR